MMQPHRSRFRLSSIVASAFLPALLLACTKPNPRDCTDGTCTDSAFPFCDVGGEVSGAPQTCIAVECTAGEFKACHGDTALTCNAAATDYDTVRCEHGCDDTFGCRLCEANQSVCIDGKTQTCDASGQVIASQTCPLGCFEDQPRCRDIDPSSGLAVYLDKAATAPDLVLSDGDFIFTSTGEIRHGQSPSPTVKMPGFYVPSKSGGSAIWVLVANHVQISGTVSVLGGGNSVAPALAIVANDTINIDGTLDFEIYSERTGISAGGVHFPECSGGPGSNMESGADFIRPASGGGGHATPGASGGNIRRNNVIIGPGGAAGKALGNATLVPLRGGCAGGSANLEYDTYPPAGGGALQLSSRTEININDHSILNLNGSSGPEPGGPMSSDGGGAGGGILLEAPVVHLGQDARLLVNGGAGSVLTAIRGSKTTAPTPGSSCDSPFCSPGGNGAALDGPATPGGDLSYPGDNGRFDEYLTGSGGGGLGFIRVNTATGIYSKLSNTIESGVVTTGTLGTR